MLQQKESTALRTQRRVLMELSKGSNWGEGSTGEELLRHTFAGGRQAMPSKKKNHTQRSYN